MKKLILLKVEVTIRYNAEDHHKFSKLNVRVNGSHLILRYNSTVYIGTELSPSNEVCKIK